MKKSSIKGSKLIIALLPTVIIVILLVWFLITIFEGEKPQAQLEPLPEYLSKGITFKVMASDLNMGLRNIKVSIKQDGPAISVLKKDFPYEGLFNKRGIYTFAEEFTLDPKRLQLVQGDANLIVEVHDFSKRRGGDGNLVLLEHKMIVDTIPPSITPISRSHNVNVGGAGLIVYRISTDTIQSGVLVDDLFFPGIASTNDSPTEIYICYFAAPYNFKKDTTLYLWAKDRADNETKKVFFYHIRQKRFRKDKITISHRVLDNIISSFPPDIFEPGKSEIEKYLLLNRRLRKENHAVIRQLCQSPTEERLWDGPWSRMKNAATMADFGDQRIYYYKGNLIDRAVHLGVDLASLARSPVQAANTGRVIFAQDLGIYGLTVIIDHGQGLYTMYGHLSSIEVAVGQPVTKGDTIGVTGTTGLATGDHLHFGFMVHGVAVNPAEWWDSHWIRDNIYRKLNMIDKLIEK
jgi:hypothetical protein